MYVHVCICACMCVNCGFLVCNISNSRTIKEMKLELSQDSVAWLNLNHTLPLKFKSL